MTPVSPFALKAKGLGFGNLKCVAVKAIRFEQTERERAKKLPPRKVKQAVLVDTSRYTGEKLRALRAKNGVGRPARNAPVEFRKAA